VEESRVRRGEICISSSGAERWVDDGCVGIGDGKRERVRKARVHHVRSLVASRLYLVPPQHDIHHKPQVAM
jgi:hypothetical protein